MKKNELLKYCKYYHGEKECPYEESDTRALFWFGEQKWVKCSDPIQTAEQGDAIRNRLTGEKLQYAMRYDNITFGIIVFIETLYSSHDPYDDMLWIYQY